MTVAIRVIPCLDVTDGRVVKGVNFTDLRDAGDPVELAGVYSAAGADELTFLDISASSRGRATTRGMVTRCASTVFIPLTVGGGVRGVDDVDALGAVDHHLVAARVDDVLVPGLQGAQQRFGAAVVAQRHVEVPEQVAKVGDEVFVKVIDIDLERRRISLSLKQANEGVDPTSEDFDPSLYGMAAEYDEQGNYKYPEGFDPETNEWLEGYDAQREAWEAEYAAAHARWEAHKAQVAKALEEEQESGAPAAPAGGTSYSSAPSEASGTLASDEALAALREKLTGN